MAGTVFCGAGGVGVFIAGFLDVVKNEWLERLSTCRRLRGAKERVGACLLAGGQELLVLHLAGQSTSEKRVADQSGCHSADRGHVRIRCSLSKNLLLLLLFDLRNNYILLFATLQLRENLLQQERLLERLVDSVVQDVHHVRLGAGLLVLVNMPSRGSQNGHRFDDFLK